MNISMDCHSFKVTTVTRINNFLRKLLIFMDDWIKIILP